MKIKSILGALVLLGASAFAQAQTYGGQLIVEPLVKRDSVLVADPLSYGVLLHDVKEGTPLALPKLELPEDSPIEICGDWQLDSTRISKRKESPARYDIKATLKLIPWYGGKLELPSLPIVMDGDTLILRAPTPIQVTEPSIDMENFQPNDIKPQLRFPLTFNEVLLYIVLPIVLLAAIAAAIVFFVKRRRMKEEEAAAEPAHLKALRKLDKLRDPSLWAPEKQKGFYSGVTDTLREYIAARYGIGAMEMTTAEIFRDIADAGIPEDLLAEMQDLFERADFVKFAKYTASEQDNAKVLPGAVRFVTTTYQQELESSEGQQEGPKADVL